MNNYPMTNVVLRTLPAIDKLPNTARGLSVHHDVIVIWDEDADDRVLSVIDALPQQQRQQLIAIHEHEGNVCFYWGKHVPREFNEPGADMLVAPGNDLWAVEHHVPTDKRSLSIGLK